MLRILLTNDDGVFAKGLAVLADTLSEIAQIHVVAPDRNRSGASNSLTLTVPMRVKYLENEMISVDGTPTDCVHVAITGLLRRPPDMVVSGINAGANLGDDVWYSGTVAAAMEGRFLGLPAIAVSLSGEHPQHYPTAAMVVYKIVERLQTEPLPVGTILNVNVPDVPYGELQGFSVTRLGTRHGAEPTIRQLDPRGHPVYWVGPAGAAADAGPGTDFAAIAERRVSITPLRIDLTHYEAFDQLTAWVHNL
jgi:5'/3'-nucleotidase